MILLKRVKKIDWVIANYVNPKTTDLMVDFNPCYLVGYVVGLGFGGIVGANLGYQITDRLMADSQLGVYVMSLMIGSAGGAAAGAVLSVGVMFFGFVTYDKYFRCKK